MKKWIFASITVFSVLNWTSYCQAQVDPSTLTLIGGGGGSGAWPTASEESAHRYVRKPHAKKIKRVIASQAPAPVVKNISEVPTPRIPAQESPATPVAIPFPAPSAETFPEKVRDVILGGDEDLIQSYKTFLESQDIRKNIFELSVASGYLYNTSQSSYFYKNYNDAGPDLDLSADIWFSPFLGFNADYRMTLLNQVSDSPTQNTYVSATQSWFNLGVKFRRFFGMSANASSFVIGVRYGSYGFNVPQTSQFRTKIQNQGPELDLDLVIPTGKSAALNFGFILQPFDSLSEGSGSSVRSGQGNQTVGLGFEMGTEFRLSRQLIPFIKISTLFYNSNFSGTATSPDPITGSTPSNVPVTNAFYFLDIGVRLGH